MICTGIGNLTLSGLRNPVRTFKQPVPAELQFHQ